eukprot:gene1096-biopygen1095
MKTSKNSGSAAAPGDRYSSLTRQELRMLLPNSNPKAATASVSSHRNTCVPSGSVPRKVPLRVYAATNSRSPSSNPNSRFSTCCATCVPVCWWSSQGKLSGWSHVGGVHPAPPSHVVSRVQYNAHAPCDVSYTCNAQRFARYWHPAAPAAPPLHFAAAMTASTARKVLVAVTESSYRTTPPGVLSTSPSASAGTQTPSKTASPAAQPTAPEVHTWSSRFGTAPYSVQSMQIFSSRSTSPT